MDQKWLLPWDFSKQNFNWERRLVKRRYKSMMVSRLPSAYRHCQELAIISPQFPKPILEIKHANRCAESHLPDLPTPSAARKYFLQEYNDVLLTK